MSENVNLQELIQVLRSIKPGEVKRKVRINESTLRQMHEQLEEDEFISLLDKIALFSNKGGFDFVKLITLRRSLRK